MLVVAELALAFVLFVASGLMTRSFRSLISARIGVDPQKVLTLRLGRNLPAPSAANETIRVNRSANMFVFDFRAAGRIGSLAHGRTSPIT